MPLTGAISCKRGLSRHGASTRESCSHRLRDDLADVITEFLQKSKVDVRSLDASRK